MQSKADILIIDDTPANLHLLAQLLNTNGYQVRALISGERALEIIANRPPDLILLDIAMPDMDGFAVCTRLKADVSTHDIPVMFISVLDETTDKIKAFAAGGVDYVTKPFVPEEVLARVSAHVELRRLHRDLEAQVVARTAALQAEIIRRQQQEQEKERLFELVRQQSDQLSVLMQKLLNDQREQRTNLVSVLEKEVIQNLNLAGSRLRAVSAAMQDLPDSPTLTTTRLRDAQVILDSTVRQMLLVTQEIDQLLPELLNPSTLTLTAREREILQLLVEGYEVTAIADWLHISTSTVYTHRQRMMQKLGADNLSDLVNSALRLGLAQSPVRPNL